MGNEGTRRYPHDVVPLLFVLFLLVPVVELAVIIQVGHVIGVWDTLGLLLVLSIGGAWLVKREGLGVVRRFQRQLEAGAIPGKELADGVLILLAGALLLTPGFVTDAVGLLLLLPPVRALLRAGLMRRLALRTQYRRGW
jgi:UPF0716 protein FxsA